jgi:hypothetical protein
MFDVQTIGVLVTAASVTVAAAYYVINIMNTNKARQLQVTMQIHTQFNNPQFWEDFFSFMEEEWSTVDEYREKYLKNPMREPHIMMWATFESVRVLVAKKLIDVSVPYDLFGEMFFNFWDKASRLVEYRRSTMAADYGIWTEFLVKRMRMYHERNPYTETLKRLSQ